MCLPTAPATWTSDSSPSGTSCSARSTASSERWRIRPSAISRRWRIRWHAHPRGRIWNFRLGLTADWRRVVERATELDKALEIDAYPDRQDLDVDVLRLAAEARCRISIGTDAHTPSELGVMSLGVASAILAVL